MIINDREFELILPKWDNDGHRISPQILREFSDKMTNHFGGVTIFPTVVGCWINDKGNMQCEENVILSSFRDSETTKNFNEQVKKDEEFINKLSREAGLKLGQQSVASSEDINEVTFGRGKKKIALSKKLRGLDLFERFV